MIGDRLGKWMIFKELGRGGMGRVYLAQDELTGHQAALKILAGELATEAGFLQRFQREIETLSALDHPNIVRFYESGHDNDLYYYAMEYVEGQSLEDILEVQNRLPWQEVLDIAQQICPALRHVHDHGVIHRDLKPSNILRASDGTIKLTDFGIAKVFASPHLTASGGIVGTAEFLSPEQASGKVVGRRSDIYSLGIVLYNLLIGRPPFTGNGYVELLHKHRYGQFDRPSKIVRDIPLELDELVCQMLEKEPDKRPRDCFVLAKHLSTVRRKVDRKGSPTHSDNSQESTQVDQSAFADLAGPGTLMSQLVREELERQNRGSLLHRFFNHPIVLVLLLGVCVGILIWTFWPAGEQQLYDRGAELMASERVSDLEKGWREYLEPLNTRFPNHPYQEEVARFKQKLDAARSPTPSEAQRFFQQGEQLRHEGQYQKARTVWSELIAVFAESDTERDWVRRAERAVTELDKTIHSKDRWTSVQPALQRAAALSRAGKNAEAERIWSSLEDLYRDDPGAAAILSEVRQERSRAKSSHE